METGAIFPLLGLDYLFLALNLTKWKFEKSKGEKFKLFFSREHYKQAPHLK